MTKPVKTYLQETLTKQLKDFRDYESSIENEWGGKRDCLNV